MSVTAFPSATECRCALTHADRQAQYRIIGAPIDTTHLEIKCAAGNIHVDVQSSEVERYKGRKVLFTQSKNNDLIWIRDWVQFYQAIHGVDAVIFYDNNSDAYSLKDIQDTIQSVEGIDVTTVVNWPFKYGPAGTKHGLCFDSEFGQHGVLEHARWRFLSNAAGAINCDIDELLLSHSGETIFRALDRSTFGTIAFAGRWLPEIHDVTPTTPQRRHADFEYVTQPEYVRKFGLHKRDIHRCWPKWAVIPSKIPSFAQFKVHTIRRWPPARKISRNFTFRHYAGITTGWRPTDRFEFSSERFAKDPLLDATYRKLGWTKTGADNELSPMRPTG